MLCTAYVTEDCMECRMNMCTRTLHLHVAGILATWHFASSVSPAAARRRLHCCAHFLILQLCTSMNECCNIFFRCRFLYLSYIAILGLQTVTITIVHTRMKVAARGVPETEEIA